MNLSGICLRAAARAVRALLNPFSLLTAVLWPAYRRQLFTCPQCGRPVYDPECSHPSQEHFEALFQSSLWRARNHAYRCLFGLDAASRRLHWFLILTETRLEAEEASASELAPIDD
jgi:hypothetical protein